MKRAIVIVLDSVGMGELPDAFKYGDVGSHTLGNIAASVQGFTLPNLERLGLGNIDGMKGYSKQERPMGCYGRMAESSAGKDTTTGHWELMGIILDKPFPVYPDAFPREIMDRFEAAIGTKTLGNVVASGTEIITRLGEEHEQTGFPIVYTSADSVFQIAAHESVVPVERLYEMCRIARGILTGEHAVGRVIARPFTGTPGNYHRTDRRHDFSLDPIQKTVLELLTENSLEVRAVGKIEDIFNKKGITSAVHIHNNMDGVDKTIEYMRDSFEGLIFTNLVDFDMLFGHRNNVQGYADALKDFDNRVPELIDMLKEDDLLFITADHGCDPTTPSTDHSREYVPVIVYGEKARKGVNLGTMETFADLGATVAAYLGCKPPQSGSSFLHQIVRM